MNDIPYKEILLLVLGSLSTYLIWRVQYQKDRLKTIESQLSDKKYKIYSDLLSLFFDLLKGDKTGEKISTQEVTKKIFDIKSGIFLYAPDDIFKKYTEWITHVSKPEYAVNHFKIYYELIVLIRKDMGNKSTNLNLDDFMLMILQDQEEYETFKKANGW